jgi:hypothetical protein
MRWNTILRESTPLPEQIIGAAKVQSQKVYVYDGMKIDRQRHGFLDL